MCPKCLQFSQIEGETLDVDNPVKQLKELWFSQIKGETLDVDNPVREFVKQLEESVQAGIFQYRGSCELEEIMEKSDHDTWHVFMCASCGQQFLLVLATHREGGYWSPMERRNEPLISKLKKEHRPLRKMKFTEEEKAALREKLRGGK